jgi:AsmA-like C-terminal region/Protein of unknown function
VITSGIKKKKALASVVISIAFLFMVLLLAIGLFLKKGVDVETLNVGNVKLSNSLLIWNDKLELQISEISFSGKEKTLGVEPKKSPTDLVGKGLSFGHYLLKIFSKLHINSLIINDTSIQLNLDQKHSQLYALSARTDDIVFSSDVTINKNTIGIEIVEAGSKLLNTEVQGKMVLDVAQGRLSGTLSATVNGDFPIAASFIADDQKITFSGQEAGEITDISSVVDLFALSPGVQRWITDYLMGSRYHLKSFKGVVPWNNPKEIVNTLEAEVTVDDTEYTFAPGLEPVKASYTDISFQYGVLDIVPHGATFYGQDCSESWVDINFNDPENILLTAYIKTQAVANDDILTLLNYYNIPLPFKQVGGKTATDLELAIILNKSELTAKGIFDIDEGVIAWGGENFGIKDAHIQLTNSDITIDRLKVSYEDFVTANVSGTILARQKIGDLDITLEMLNVKLGEAQLTIDESNPLHAAYHFDSQSQVLDTRSSSWLLDSLVLELGAFRAPINVKDLSMEIPKAHLGTPPGIDSEFSGNFSLKNKQADFTCELLKFHGKDLKLTSPHIVVDIEYDDGLVIGTEETAEWELHKMPVTLFPSQVKYSDDVLTVVSSRMSYGELFDSYLAGYFNRKQKKGQFSLNKIDITNETLEEKLTLGENIDLEVSAAGGSYHIFFPLFDLKISTATEKKWSAHFSDLSAVYSRSKILQKYKIREGSLMLSSENGKKPYDFSADIKSPYPLLVEDGHPVDTLHITGQLTDTGIIAKINKNLTLEYADRNLTLTSQDLGYNISAIIDMMRERPKSSENSKKETNTQTQSFLLTLAADESQIYLGPKSRVLADTINFTLQNGNLQMDLAHGQGNVTLKLTDGVFTLNGSELNDEFMGALIQDSRFAGGEMFMSAKGDMDEFSAIFEIKNTALSELATVNNIMAFMNTVPALVTFSLPEYSRKGFPVDSATVGMVFKDKVAQIESMEIHSPELRAKGKGTIDFGHNVIDMDINLKTQASQNVGKIPVVGYVLAGKDDDDSLSLKIKGGLDNPEVDYSLIKNIVVYPAEILYRTFKLPFHLGRIITNQPPEDENVNSNNLEEKND